VIRGEDFVHVDRRRVTDFVRSVAMGETNPSSTAHSPDVRSAVRGAATALALALVVVGCGFVGGEPVELLTGVVPQYTAGGGCFLGSETGKLIVDSKYGTAFMTGANGIVPVMWPPGFTGRRVGSEVVVLDPLGNALATTGRTYQIGGLVRASEPHPEVSWDPNDGSGTARSDDGSRIDSPRVFVACGDSVSPM
jgi:hypothetical protein